jgi:uncharacterized protein (DUF2267 family)
VGAGDVVIEPRKPAQSKSHDNARDVVRYVFKVLTDRYNLDKDDLA